MDRRLTTAAIAATVLLAGCEGGGDPVNQAMTDTVTANRVAAHPAGHHSGSVTPGDAAFAASEAAMHEAMALASGQTVDQAYIAKMIEHHRGAVAMAEVALERSRDPEIRRMARAVVDAQTREIAEMQAWEPATRP